MLDLRPRLQDALADRYRLGTELGRGGMAVVYLARDLKHERDVALKVLRPEVSASLGPERFLREIKLAAGLTHPHILPLHDSGEAAGLLYYVMPYVQGESLRHRLEREGRLPLDQALPIAREVADALEYAHQQNVVHRDIKPENILFEAEHAVVADFGIARAISAAGGARVTAVGIAVGTPDYMSPEQAGAGDLVDGRSDVYSLGVVLYEMLTGHPPFVAKGSEQREGGRVRASASLTGERPGIPLEVELAVETALATLPADRYQSAGEFGRALAPGVAVVGSGERRRRIRRRRWLAGVAGVLAAGALAVAVWPRLFGAGLDQSLYVVVPFGHREGAAPKLVTGDRCESLLIEAFGRWADVRLVDELRVHDLRLRRGAALITLETALEIARSARSGRLVWGDVAEFGDTVHVRAALYDVARGGATVRRHAVRFAAETRDIGEKFRELADSLLLGHVRSPEAAGGSLGTRLLAAWQTFHDGQAALIEWNLAGAEQRFRRAVELDPEYAHAHLWLAQALIWAGRPPDLWRAHSVIAAAMASRLGLRERSLARALANLADQEFTQACDEYQRLLRRDSLDFAAWFGLGECQAQDRLVVRDPSSASGWRFRSSHAAAARAYQRALELIPSVHRAFAGVAFTRLNRLFYAEVNSARIGYAVAPDTVQFGALPALEHDSLAFTPVPLADLVASRPGTTPPTNAAAVARNREVLRRITFSWVTAFPGSADAHEALARVLEAMGELRDAMPPELSALATLRRARRFATDSVQRLRLVASEVRVLVKLEQFAAARLISDSVLGGRPLDTPEEADEAAGLAALTGRVYLTAKLLSRGAPLDTARTWDGDPVIPPRPVAEAARALLGYASFGRPRDSLVALLERVERQVTSWVDERRRPKLRQAVLHFPLALAFPELGLSSLHGPATGGAYLLGLQWDLAHNDTAAVRRRFRMLDQVRSDLRPGDIPVFFMYSEAWALLALGDTSAAVRRLDASLMALQTHGLNLASWAPEAAMLARAMALRAELAEKTGDPRTAKRWAHAVVALWAGADEPLQGTVGRMRQLAAN